MGNDRQTGARSGAALSPRHVAIIVCCCLTSGLPAGMLMNTPGIFYPVIAEELGVQTAEISAWMAICLLSAALFQPVVGNIVGRVRMRTLMLAGALVMIGVFAVFASATAPWMFWLVAAITGLPFATCLSVGPATLVNRWFQRHVGLLLGVFAGCSALGGVVFMLVGQAIIDSAGWRAAYVAYAAVIAVVCVPAIVLGVRDYPADCGLLPYGADADVGQAADEIRGSRAEGPAVPVAGAGGLADAAAAAGATGPGNAAGAGSTTDATRSGGTADVDGVAGSTGPTAAAGAGGAADAAAAAGVADPGDVVGMGSTTDATDQAAATSVGAAAGAMGPGDAACVGVDGAAGAGVDGAAGAGGAAAPGDSDDSSSSDGSDADLRRRARRCMRTPPFLLLLFAGFLMNMVCQVNGYLPKYVYWVEAQNALGLMPAAFVAGVVLSSLTQAGSAVGKVLLGAFSDFSVGKALTVLCAAGAAGMACVWTMPATPLMPLGGFVYGFFLAAVLVLVPMLVRSIFGGGELYPILYARVAVAPAFGGAAANIVWPYLADNLGGFDAVFGLALVMIALLLAASLAALRLGRE